MGFEYVSVEEAIARDGLRMVVVGGVATPTVRGVPGVAAVAVTTGCSRT